MSRPMQCKSSHAFQKRALEIFVKMPIRENMIDYLTEKAIEVIQIENPPTCTSRHLPPSPPQTPTREKSFHGIPSVKEFITHLIVRSNVQTPTLMTTVVYLDRLRMKLSPVAKGIRCTVHRIFLAALILSAKFLNDSSPKNKHWAEYSHVKGRSTFGFTQHEVNLMEKQLLSLLDWDLNVTESDLFPPLDPFLFPICRELERQERKMSVINPRKSATQDRSKEGDASVSRASNVNFSRARKYEAEHATKNSAEMIYTRTPLLHHALPPPQNKATPPPLSAVPSLHKSGPSSSGSSVVSLPFSRAPTPNSMHNSNEACLLSPATKTLYSIRQSASTLSHGYHLPNHLPQPPFAPRRQTFHIHIADQYIGHEHNPTLLNKNESTTITGSPGMKPIKFTNRIQRATTLFSCFLGKTGVA